MVGIVLVAHYGLASALLEAATFINGQIQGIKGISVENMEISELRKRIAEAVKEVDQGKGVLILTDMFGGTPSNLSFSFLQEGKVEVVTGVNLPMVLGIINKRNEANLETLARYAKEKGLNSIVRASEVLKG